MTPAFIDRLKEISPSLKALGRALPTQTHLTQAARLGELATKNVPMLDLSAWLSRDGGRAGSVDAAGNKIIRARDLLALHDQPMAMTLQAKVAQSLAADIFELTGIRFYFAHGPTSSDVQGSDQVSTQASIQEVVNG